MFKCIRLAHVLVVIDRKYKNRKQLLNTVHTFKMCVNGNVTASNWFEVQKTWYFFLCGDSQGDSIKQNDEYSGKCVSNVVNFDPCTCHETLIPLVTQSTSVASKCSLLPTHLPVSLHPQLLAISTQYRQQDHVARMFCVLPLLFHISFKVCACVACTTSPLVLNQ